MIKETGRFRLHSSIPYSWLFVDGKIEHLTLSEDDLIDLYYLTGRGIANIGRRKKIGQIKHPTVRTNK